VLISSITPSVAASVCTPIDFAKLFYADYKSGSHWDNSSGDLVITWSAQSAMVNDQSVERVFTESERGWLRAAFKSWDQALTSLSFVEVETDAGITIGYVDLAAHSVQPDAVGFWTSWASGGIRSKATIKLKASKTQWFSDRRHFIHSVQHELGNVLGLGDIAPNKKFASVLEDPWQPPYGASKLGATDIALIKQLYGEATTCSKKGESYLPRSQGKVAGLV
jgi:hypothetical protein